MLNINRCLICNIPTCDQGQMITDNFDRYFIKSTKKSKSLSFRYGICGNHPHNYDTCFTIDLIIRLRMSALNN